MSDSYHNHYQVFIAMAHNYIFLFLFMVVWYIMNVQTLHMCTKRVKICSFIWNLGVRKNNYLIGFIYILIAYLYSISFKLKWCWHWSGSVIVTSLQTIIRNEGLRGLYRGLSPTLAALLPNWAVSVIYVNSKFLLLFSVISWYKYFAYIGLFCRLWTT